MILSAHQGLLGRQKVTTTEVEYLEGDGSAFICIPYQAQMGDIVSVEYQRVDRNSAWVFGARHNSSNSFGFAFQHSRNNDNLSRQSLHVHSGSYAWYSAWLSGANVQMDKTSTTIDSTAMVWTTWDGVEKPVDFTQFNYSHGNFGLFGVAAPDGTPWATSTARIYAFRVIRDGALLVDLVPVRQGKKGFMYDKVSGQLFGNTNTGKFIVGSDKLVTAAMSYVQDGLIAHWDGVENVGYGKHDANATTWRDLVSDTDLVGTDGVAWGDDHYLAQDGQYWAQAFADRQDLVESYTSGRFTIEAVVGIDPTLYPASDTYPFYLGASNDSLRLYCKPAYRNGGWWFKDSYTVDRQMESRELHTLATILDVTKSGANAFIYNDSNKSYSFMDATASRGSIGSATNLLIGRANNVSNGLTYFAGKIHSIRWYDRALTIEELTHNYAVDKERFGL